MPTEQVAHVGHTAHVPIGDAAPVLQLGARREQVASTAVSSSAVPINVPGGDGGGDGGGGRGALPFTAGADRAAATGTQRCRCSTKRQYEEANADLAAHAEAISALWWLVKPLAPRRTWRGTHAGDARHVPSAQIRGEAAGIKEHVAHAGDARHVPSAQIRGEAAGSIEHLVHAGDARHVPSAQIRGEAAGRTEHGAHAGDARHVPSAQIRGEAAGTMNMELMLVTLDTSQALRSEVKLLAP